MKNNVRIKSQLSKTSRKKKLNTISRKAFRKKTEIPFRTNSTKFTEKWDLFHEKMRIEKLNIQNISKYTQRKTQIRTNSQKTRIYCMRMKYWNSILSKFIQYSILIITTQLLEFVHRVKFQNDTISYTVSIWKSIRSSNRAILEARTQVRNFLRNWKERIAFP